MHRLQLYNDSGLHKLWVAGLHLLRISPIFEDVFDFTSYRYKDWGLRKCRNQKISTQCFFCFRKAKNSCFAPKTLIYGIFVANVAKKHNIRVWRVKFWETLLMRTSRKLGTLHCNEMIPYLFDADADGIWLSYWLHRGDDNYLAIYVFAGWMKEVREETVYTKGTIREFFQIFSSEWLAGRNENKQLMRFVRFNQLFKVYVSTNLFGILGFILIIGGQLGFVLIIGGHVMDIQQLGECRKIEQTSQNWCSRKRTIYFRVCTVHCGTCVGYSIITNLSKLMFPQTTTNWRCPAA